MFKFLTVMLLSIGMYSAQAQTDIPQGYTKGSVTLSNGTTVSGFIKNNIRRNASVTVINEATKAKADYDGNDLATAQVDGNKYLTVGGDFFQVVTEGELNYIQKASDVSGKVVYNGLENVIMPGTEGKPGDYFIMNTSTRELSKVSKRNVNEAAANLFAGCTAAIEKAKAVNGDLAMVKDAVVIYNNRNK